MRNGEYRVSPQTAWINLGSITTAASDHGVTARDYATVEAVTGELTLATKEAGVPYAMLLRFRSDGSENDSNVLQMYAARGKDDYHKIAQLTLAQGQQKDSGSIYFADTITPASEDALFDGEESNITNHIAHYYVRTLGFDRFSFIATTLTSTTVYIDYCFLYE